jgi:L-asparaginase II
MARGWAYFVAIAAFAALAVDVRGHGTEDAGANGARSACIACQTHSGEPAAAALIADISENSNAAWGDSEVANGNTFHARVLHSQKEDELSAPKK